eukprot:CAMPEP_0197708486 /NCGR_PEP_ID=MMETSP1338-20131121/127975_1 /TAXON_ID=43686 ORGANISM="Pelagodinium beii, Strain RCC1491" /NCGR_SAMPLE_ID=MMETSP1338 /ASSEMBLY_ACC=CAM_ASM_000754 /LENGTH=128 /DNA_ID=CAMNT_0043292417 /DNA_START=1107 /DNA_END=1493 /DNA_ORIENTATION=+
MTSVSDIARLAGNVAASICWQVLTSTKIVHAEFIFLWHRTWHQLIAACQGKVRLAHALHLNDDASLNWYAMPSLGTGKSFSDVAIVTRSSSMLANWLAEGLGKDLEFLLRIRVGLRALRNANCSCTCV